MDSTPRFLKPRTRLRKRNREPAALKTCKSGGQDLFEDIRALTKQARATTARTINSAVTLLYWQVAQRIRRGLLHEQRAEYGEQIVATLSQQLTEEFGRGWNKAALTRMMQFAERFPDPKIVATPAQQLTWSYVVELLPLKDSLQRDFYAEMCRLENWSVRTLRQRSTGCFLSALVSRESQPNWQRRNFKRCAMKTDLHPIWSSAILTC